MKSDVQELQELRAGRGSVRMARNKGHNTDGAVR
jgi:hypothetical protein